MYVEYLVKIINLPVYVRGIHSVTSVACRALNFATPWTVADLKRFLEYKLWLWNSVNNRYIIGLKIRHFCIIIVHIVVIEIVVLVWKLSTTWNHNFSKWNYLLLDACVTIRLCLCMIMDTNEKIVGRKLHVMLHCSICKPVLHKIWLVFLGKSRKNQKTGVISFIVTW